MNNTTIDIDDLKKNMKKELEETIETDMAQQLSRLDTLWKHQLDMSTYDKDHADYRTEPAIKAIKQHCRIDTKKVLTDSGYTYSINLITDGKINMSDYIAELIDLMWSNTEKMAAYTV